MRQVGRDGAMVVIHRDWPEAMILSINECQRLEQAAATVRACENGALATLRRQFDEHLAALSGADTGARLREVFRSAAALDGRVRAGQPCGVDVFDLLSK